MVPDANVFQLLYCLQFLVISIVDNLIMFLLQFCLGFLRDIESLASQYEDCILLRKLEDKNRLLRKVQTILISAQELGDEKLQIVQHLQDLIENRTRSLDNDYRNIGKEYEILI